MKIFITGIAGFIGYHTAHAYIESGHEVVGIDNFNDYYDPSLKYARSNLLEDAGVTVRYEDLREPAGYFDLLAGSDLVIHLGASAGVRHSFDNAEGYIQNNIIATQRLIDTCEKLKIDNVVYASTSCVMAGNPLPWNEDEKLGYQKNPYGYTKACNEAQFMASRIKSTVGLRFFTVYGPWGRPDMALFDFTKNIVAENPIQLFNYGDMKRDFTYIDDIVNGIQTVAEHMKEDMNEIYNIGYGDQVELVDFVDAIEENVGKEAIRELVPPHPADTLETWSDTSKLQALGWKPTTPIHEGVAKFIEWYKKYYGVN